MQADRTTWVCLCGFTDLYEYRDPSAAERNMKLHAERVHR